MEMLLTLFKPEKDQSCPGTYAVLLCREFAILYYILIKVK